MSRQMASLLASHFPMFRPMMKLHAISADFFSNENGGVEIFSLLESAPEQAEERRGNFVLSDLVNGTARAIL